LIKAKGPQLLSSTVISFSDNFAQAAFESVFGIPKMGRLSRLMFNPFKIEEFTVRMNNGDLSDISEMTQFSPFFT